MAPRSFGSPGRGVPRVHQFSEAAAPPPLRHPLRPRVVAIAPSLAEVVHFAGGWLFDQVMAGRDVTVLTADHTDPRPLRILGTRAADLETVLARPLRVPCLQAIAVRADLFEADARVRRLVLEALAAGPARGPPVRRRVPRGPGRHGRAGAAPAERGGAGVQGPGPGGGGPGWPGRGDRGVLAARPSGPAWCPCPEAARVSRPRGRPCRWPGHRPRTARRQPPRQRERAPMWGGARPAARSPRTSASLRSISAPAWAAKSWSWKPRIAPPLSRTRFSGMRGISPAA